MKVTTIAAAGLAAMLAFGLVPSAAQEAAELTVRTSDQHGPYIADGEGRSLYLFEADTQGVGNSKPVSKCADACAEFWPPLIAEAPKAGDQVYEDFIGTIQRADGKTQVTYGGWPLYYFSQDRGPGDTTGHDIEGFGAEWYLLNPTGEKVGG